MGERRVIVLGSTGSIGTQTLDVIAHLNGLFERGEWPVRHRVVGLAAGRNAALLAEQARAFGVGDLALADGAGGDSSPAASGAASGAGSGSRVRSGSDAALRLVREVECDVVVAAMVGAAGLPATLAAVELGRDVALANKETLVAAGALVVPAAVRSGARLLPVDSEHSAVWQGIWGRREERHEGTEGRRHGGGEREGHAPPMVLGRDVARVVLTASGGALRGWARERAYQAMPAEALKHPTWSMGPKVTIDSASLMNKALELIEAHWLFGLEPARMGVVIHPQSVVHALVEYADGSVMAQLGRPDMRTPIQVALSFPGRAAGLGGASGAAARMDWAGLARLDFEAADEGRYPALALARVAIERGGTAGAVLNGANEAAVEAFLAQSGTRAMPLGRIAEVVAEAMAGVETRALDGIADAMDADGEARRFVRGRLEEEGFVGAAGSGKCARDEQGRTSPGLEDSATPSASAEGDGGAAVRAAEALRARMKLS